MRVLPRTISFEWDEGNLDKSYKKHDITPKEAEEIFVSEELYVLPDIKHSQKEKRFIALGKSQGDKLLFAVFTIRKARVRIISVRRMHQKEIKKYEKAKENSEV